MATSIVITWLDESGETASTQLNVPDATPAGELQDFAVAATNITGVLTTGGITGVSIIQNVALSLISPALLTASAGSDVEEKGYFQFVTVDGYPTKMSIPTFREDLIVAGTDNVDQANADVAAYIAMMETGITPNAVLIQPCDSRESDVANVVIAEERFISRN